MSIENLLDSQIGVTDILDANVNGMIILNKDLTVLLWNKWIEGASGISKEEAIGQLLWELFPGMSGSRIDKSIQAAFESGNASLISNALNRQPFPLKNSENRDQALEQMIYINPVTTSDGVRQCLIQIDDVTTAVRREKLLRKTANEAQIAKEAAEEVSHLKSSFISIVSHELRTPMTSIRGSLGLIHSKVLGEVPDDIYKLISIAFNNAKSLLILINDILDIEKIEAGKLDYHLTDVNISELLSQAVENTRAYGEQYEITFKLNINDNNTCIKIDRERMLQVMNNLLSNAAKFSPVGGVVEIVSGLHKGMLRISIADHGVGIPESFQSQLFDKFTQATNYDINSRGGTGLGLSISKAIVEEHAGVISFDTEENKGTTFYVDLPLPVPENTTSP